MKRTVAFKTLGCRLNQHETDALAADFHGAGYEVAGFDAAADVYVVNTCTVTGASDRKSRNHIGQALRRGPGTVVVVTGCMAEKERDALERDGVTYVVDNSRKPSIVQLVEAHYRGEVLHPWQLPEAPFGHRAGAGGFHTRGMVKIQDGCDNYCTFCIIPMVRGRAVSRAAKDVLDDVRRAVDGGIREIILTGVNIGRYEHDGLNFEALVGRILALDLPFRLRVTSLEPDGFSEALFDLLTHERMTPHLHLCLQSGSDRILRRMRRMYTAAQYMAVVEAARARIPDFNFTTDVMVGFPGETDADVEETLAICRAAGFSHIHTFRYSMRGGTRAARMDEQVPEPVKAARSEAVREVAEANRLRYLNGFVGKRQVVLVEGIADGWASGYGQHYVPVRTAAGGLERNRFHEVTISRVDPADGMTLIGEELGDGGERGRGGLTA